MEEKKKKNYEVPQLTTVTFKTERGYAFSDLSSTFIHQNDVNQSVENTTFGRSSYGTAEGENYFSTWE